MGNSKAGDYRAAFVVRGEGHGAELDPVLVELPLTADAPARDQAESRTRATAAAQPPAAVSEDLCGTQDGATATELAVLERIVQPRRETAAPSSLPVVIESRESAAAPVEIIREPPKTPTGGEAPVRDEEPPLLSDVGEQEAVSEVLPNATDPRQYEEPVSSGDEEGEESEEQPKKELERETVLRRYRSPVQRPPQIGSDKQQKTKEGTVSKTISSVDLGIRVNLTFDRRGLCSINFFPERTEGLDSDVPVELNGKLYLLVGEDDSYAGFFPENVGRILREGIELKAVLSDERDARWRLPGRDLYVLASSKLAHGFLSTNRLVLGRSHVVLCAGGLADEVECLLRDGGSQGHARLGNDDGIPDGWVGFRDVRPAKALRLEIGSDPLYPIKAAPDIEIDLEGGICLGGSAWLAGYPPAIKILGEATGKFRTLIDGKDAVRSQDGLLTADGCGAPGSHSVYCEGQSCSRTYSIEEAPRAWDRWQAHSFAKGTICGPLVELRAAGNWRSVTVPMSNPVLLGSHPGEIFHCSMRDVPVWKGFVPFGVVWALPAQPLRSDKKNARILRFADMPVVPGGDTREAAREWSVAILDASRKGLKIENGSVPSVEMWREYKRTARSIWRAAR